MELHLFLRHIEKNTIVKLLDLQSQLLYQGFSQDIPIEYYEYPVFRMKIGELKGLYASKASLDIVIEK
jgi:hypothetical protein